jgi:single stranded DNA-binding protein
MNRVHLSGHLGEDADVQQHGGLTVARLRLGTTSTFRDREGKLRTRTDWHRITLFDALARRVEHLREGDRLTVRGALRTYSFKRGGEQRVSVEVVASQVEIAPAAARRLNLDGSPAGSRAHRPRRTPRPRLAGSRRRAHPGTVPDPAELLGRLLLPGLNVDADGV